MELFEDHGVLKWKCSYTTSSRILWGEAEGSVTDFSPPNLQGTGVYTKHQVSGAEGTRQRDDAIAEQRRVGGVFMVTAHAPTSGRSKQLVSEPRARRR